MASRRKPSGGKPGKPAIPMRDVNATMRVKLALELHLAGHRWDDIAAQAGYGSRGAAYNAVKRELNRQVEQPTAEARAAEIARLDLYLTVYHPKAMQGDGWSLDRCLRISERRGRLLGLDMAPVPHPVVEQGQITIIAIPQDVLEAV